MANLCQNMIHFEGASTCLPESQIQAQIPASPENLAQSRGSCAILSSCPSAGGGGGVSCILLLPKCPNLYILLSQYQGRGTWDPTSYTGQNSNKKNKKQMSTQIFAWISPHYAWILLELDILAKLGVGAHSPPFLICLCIYDWHFYKSFFIQVNPPLLGKAICLHCQVPWKGLKALDPLIAYSYKAACFLGT